MSSINAVGAPTQPVTLSRQERLASANQNPPPETSPQNLAAQQQQIDNDAARERAERRIQVNETDRAAEIRDQRSGELADKLRAQTTPTPLEREQQERKSPEYGRFDIPMPVNDAMGYLLDIRDERRDQTAQMFDRLTADTQAVNEQFAPPSSEELAAERAAIAPEVASNLAPSAAENRGVYPEVNAMTAAQVYEEQRNDALDNQSAVAARESSQNSLVDIFGERNLNAATPPEPAVPNYTVSPPANPQTNPAASDAATAANSAAAGINGAPATGAVGATPAMRTLASGVRVSTAVDPTAVVNEIRPVAANSASMLIDTQNLQNDYNTFNAINNSISNIGAQSSAIFNASQDSIRTPVNALKNQAAVDNAVDQIAANTQSVVAQSERLRAVNAGELTMVNSALRDLGATPDPRESNQTVALQDLRANGRASQTNDPQLAAQISETASRGVSAVRNTVDTLQGNLLSAASTTLDTAMRRTEQLASGVNGRFSASGNAAAAPIANPETANAVVEEVAADLAVAPRRALTAGSANIDQINAAALAR